MDLLKGKVKTIYFKYLAAAFGSSLIASIYGVVDLAVVGQYHGPEGTAAISVISPFWNLIYSLGLLMGIGGVGLAVLAWLGLIFFDRELLLLFGADATLLPLARAYLRPIKFIVPSFLMSQLLSAFIRNDGNPALATKAVLFGGIFNVFGDVFFVFTLDMGIMGAGLATAMGSFFSVLIMLSHFFRKGNSLRYALLTIAFFSLFWTGLSLAAPNPYIRVFTTPTPEVLAIGPSIIRRYCVSFLLLPLNIFSTYYFQALMKPGTSFIVSVSRGAVISGLLIYLLPMAAGANAIWFAMPITELIVGGYVTVMMFRITKQLENETRQARRI